MVLLDGCVVPASNLLGKEGQVTMLNGFGIECGHVTPMCVLLVGI